MKSILRRRFLLASLFLLTWLAHETKLRAQDVKISDVEITVGDSVLKIPAPAGQRAVSRSSSAFKNVETALPPMLRLEAAFYELADADRVEKGEPADGSFSQVQINKNIETKRLSQSDFTELRKSMTKELKDSANIMAEAEKAMSDSSKRLSDGTGAELKLSPGQSEFFSPHLDRPGMLGFSFRMGFQVSVAGREGAARTMTATGVMTHVRGRAVQLYTYANGSDAAALEASRKSAKAWAEAVIAANPVQHGDEKSTSGFDWSRVGSQGAIGGIVGAVVALFALLFRKKKSAV